MGHTKASAHAFHIGIRVMITGNHHNVHHPAATSYLVAELRSVHARIVQVQNCAIQSSPVQSSPESRFYSYLRQRAVRQTTETPQRLKRVLVS